MSSTNTLCFLPLTRDLSYQIGKSISVTLGAYGGLWSLYNSANVLKDLNDKPDWKRLEKHLLGDTPDIPGIDLKHIASCSWADHQNHFVEMTLMQAIMMFEEWCSGMAEMFSTPKLKVKSETFQFPTGSVNSRYDNWALLDNPGAFVESSLIRGQVQPKFMEKNASNVASLDSLLNWYRYFKSVRNSLAHGGGILDQYSLELYKVAAMTGLKSLGMARNYNSPAPTVGAKAIISLPDSLLLLGIVQRIAFAFDAKYCHVERAEHEIKNKTEAALAGKRIPKYISTEQKNRWLRKLWMSAAGAPFQDLSVIEAWFSSQGLVTIKVF